VALNTINPNPIFTVNSVLFEDSHFRGFRGSHQTTKVGIRRKLVTLHIYIYLCVLTIGEGFTNLPLSKFAIFHKLTEIGIHDLNFCF